MWKWIKREVRANRGKVTAAVVTALAWASTAMGVPIPEPVLEWGTITLLAAIVGTAAGEAAVQVQRDALDDALRKLQRAAEDTERRAHDLESGD